MSSTVGESVVAAAHRLRAAGIPDSEADADARLMAQWLLGWDTARYLTAAAHEFPPDTFQGRYELLVARREQREPMAYLFRGQEFWGLMFEVTPAVLIPRPETELIVETALELFADRNAALLIGDIGTGSGCLAVALATEWPNARVFAADISEQAVEIAVSNAVRHRVAHRVQVGIGSVVDFPFPHFDEPFDLLASNPPYVPEGDRPALAPEVRDHEPALALFAGDDGLAVIRQLPPIALTRLKPGGYLLFEFGFGQADAVRQLISGTPGLTMVGLKSDLQGIPRVAVVGK